jgi:hypothetical protein
VMTCRMAKKKVLVLTPIALTQTVMVTVTNKKLMRALIHWIVSRARVLPMSAEFRRGERRYIHSLFLEGKVKLDSAVPATGCVEARRSGVGPESGGYGVVSKTA